jgi:hypothetical protein
MYRKLSEIPSKIFSKLGDKPLFFRVALVFLAGLFFFIEFHHSSLRWFEILFFEFQGILIGFCLFTIAWFTYQKLGYRRTNIVLSFIITLVSFLIYYKSGLFKTREGLIFLVLFLFAQMVFYVTSSQFMINLGVYTNVVFLSCLTVFYADQKSEELISYLYNKSKYGFNEIEFNDWKIDGRVYTHEHPFIQFELPNDLYFYPASAIEWDESMGIGKIVSILAYSDRDPNLYPLIKIFYIPNYYSITEQEIREEFFKALLDRKEKGEFDEIKSIPDVPEGPKDSKGEFYSFYDVLRPRYSKIGYYTVYTNDNDIYLITIQENLEKYGFHEQIIQATLDKLRIEN